MKTKILITLATLCLSGLLAPAIAQPADAQNNNAAAQPDQPPPPDAGGDNAAGEPPPAMNAQPQPAQSGTNAVDQSQPSPAENQPVESAVILPRGSAPQAVSSPYTPPAQAVGAGANDLSLNFVSAPLDQVLNYLSDAAGFIVVQEARVSGSVTIRGSHLTKDEAVDLVNAELNKNGFAAIRDGRTLTIVEKSEAKTRNIPVKTGNNPATIPNDDVMVTQIIPIRFVEARQLVSDLSSFVSVAGDDCGQRGRQFDCHHRHAGQHPASGRNHPGD